MEITTYQAVTEETHVLGGQEILLKLKCEIVDTIAYYPTTGDKEFPSDSCDWQNEDDDDWEMYRILKKEYHETYGPLTLKQYATRMRLMMTNFNSAERLGTPTKRYIARIWALKQIYELADNSLCLLFTRMKKGIISLYEQAVKFKNDIAEMSLDEEVKKYIKVTLNVMDCVCEKINAYFAENPALLASLSIDAKGYFFQSASPEIISRVGYLQKTRWIEPELVPHITPKYYAYWKNFWATLIIRSFYARQICLGEDVCEKIAEFIPTRIEGLSFVEFFQKHFHVENNAYIGVAGRPRRFLTICNETRSEIIIILT